MSSYRRHARRSAGTSRAAARPLTVTTRPPRLGPAHDLTGLVSQLPQSQTIHRRPVTCASRSGSLFTSAGSRLAKALVLGVTGRGRPVAVLAPLPESTPLAGLVAGGLLRPALHDRRRFPAPVAAGTGLRSALRWPSIAPATVDRVRRLLRTGDAGRHRKRNRGPCRGFGRVRRGGNKRTRGRRSDPGGRSRRATLGCCGIAGLPVSSPGR